MNSMLNFLSSASPVTIVGNKELPNNPLVTPFLDSLGNPKTDNNDRPIGSIMLMQHQRTLNGTFINASNRVAFLSGTIEELENIIKQNKLVDGSGVPGKIIIRESLTPFHAKQMPKINPSSGDVIEYEVKGKKYPVFMQMSYTPDEKAADTLLRDIESVAAWLNARTVNKIAEEANQGAENARVPGNEQITP